MWYSLASAAVGAVPIPVLDIGADIPIFLKMIAEQREQFGLTGQNLATIARELGFCSADDLLERIDKGSTKKAQERNNQTSFLNRT